MFNVYVIPSSGQNSGTVKTRHQSHIDVKERGASRALGRDTYCVIRVAAFGLDDLVE